MRLYASLVTRLKPCVNENQVHLNCTETRAVPLMRAIDMNAPVPLASLSDPRDYNNAAQAHPIRRHSMDDSLQCVHHLDLCDRAALVQRGRGGRAGSRRNLRD